jgi:hypothetical protein
MIEDDDWQDASLIGDYEIDPAQVLAQCQIKQHRRHPRRKRFIFGPISVEWLARAITLGWSVTRTALLIRHLEGLNRGKRTMFPVSNALLADFRLTRQGKYSGIKRMADAGLIGVKHRPGASPLVTVVEVQPPQPRRL